MTMTADAPPGTRDPNATVTMQGIIVPASSVDPKGFFAKTRRLRNLERSIGAWQGFGGTDQVELRKAGVLAAVDVHFVGTLTATPGTGTVATTSKWPYGLLRAARFSANGESNLIQADGIKVKARDIVARGDLTDRGVVNAIGGASPGTSRNQGTMAMASESWGVGQNVTAIGAGNYNVDLSWRVPVAENMQNLLGAIFAQTSATALELYLDWANQGDLFTLTGNAAVALTGTITAESVAFRIPGNGQGGILVPDLRAFHGFIQNRRLDVGNGPNEFTLAGQGVGRQLLRIMFQTWSGNPPAPLALTATNYVQPYWRYGAADTPETFADGQQLRYNVERTFDSDLGGLAGIGIIDFANEWAFRDSVDEGAATELRFGFQIPAAVGLVAPAVEYVSETIFGSGLGA